MRLGQPTDVGQRAQLKAGAIVLTRTSYIGVCESTRPSDLVALHMKRLDSLRVAFSRLPVVLRNQRISPYGAGCSRQFWTEGMATRMHRYILPSNPYGVNCETPQDFFRHTFLPKGFQDEFETPCRPQNAVICKDTAQEEKVDRLEDLAIVPRSLLSH